jgi:hypothetical protein
MSRKIRSFSPRDFDGSAVLEDGGEGRSGGFKLASQDPDEVAGDQLLFNRDLDRRSTFRSSLRLRTGKYERSCLVQRS